MVFSSVDLPAPLGPMIATISPASTRRPTPRRVLDQDEGHSPRVQPADGRDERAHQRRVDARSRLVEQDQHRIRHEDARQLQQLFLPAGERSRLRIAEGGEVGQREDLERAGPERGLLTRDLGAAGDQPAELLAPLVLGVEQEVLEHRQPRQRSRDLEGPRHAEPGDRVGGAAREAVRAEADVTGIGRQEAAHHVEERRLARAVGPDEAGDAAAGDLQAHAVQRREAAEALLHVADRQERLSRHSRSLPPPSSPCSLPLRGRGFR